MPTYQFNRNDLEQIYIDRNNYYSLLVDRNNKVLILEVVITWIAWYSVYFWLSPEEYRLFKENKPAFDRLVDSYARDKGERFFTRRLLRNEGPGGDRQHQGDEPEPVEDL